MATGGWQWQLRDAKGRWIQMGSNVVFMRNGQPVTGEVVGSPGPGKATIKLPDGSVVTVPTSGLTVTAGPTPAKKPAAAKNRQVKAHLPAGKGDRGKGVSSSSSSRGSSNSDTGESEGMEKPDDNRLAGAHRTSRVIEALIREAARKRGVKDPFGEKDKKRKPLTSRQKADRAKKAKERREKEGASGKSESTKKKREDKRKPLTDSQAKAVSTILSKILADVREGHFGGALSRLDRAADLLKDTSAPWLSKRISFLKKGIGTMYGASGATASAAVLAGALLAGGNGESWRWQLRDKDGQWIKMGTRVSWLERGLIKLGTVIDNPSPGVARVQPDGDGDAKNMRSNRLSVVESDALDVPDVIPHAKGPRVPKKPKADVKAIVSMVREQGGASVKIDGTQPTKGFMAAQKDGGDWISADAFFSETGINKRLADFMEANGDAFDDPDTYLGLWWDKKHDVVTVDVSHNIEDHDAAVQYGKDEDQISVWDVVNMEEVSTGGTGGYANAGEAVHPPSEAGEGDDSGGTGGVVPDGGGRVPIPEPPVSGVNRPANPQSSMSTVPEEWRPFINNGAGTREDPVHVGPGDNPITIRQSDIEAHVLRIMQDALNGIPAYADPKGENAARLAAARTWYPQARQETSDMLEDLHKQYPDADLPDLRTTLGMVAAMSPKTPWDKNVWKARVAIETQLDAQKNHPDWTAEEVSLATHLGMYRDVTTALKLMRGELSDEELGGLKRQSFWNNLVNPDDDWDATVDGWIASAIARMGATHADGTLAGEKGALAWVGHAKTKTVNGVKQPDPVEGAGYVVMADAFRRVAADLQMLPNQIQAIYWTSIGGGLLDSMWDIPKGYTALPGTLLPSVPVEVAA